MTTMDTPIDRIFLVIYCQMVQLNLAVIHPSGVWYSDTSTTPHMFMVHKGSNEFGLTESIEGNYCVNPTNLSISHATVTFFWVKL